MCFQDCGNVGVSSLKAFYYEASPCLTMHFSYLGNDCFGESTLLAEGNGFDLVHESYQTITIKLKLHPVYPVELHQF